MITTATSKINGKVTWKQFGIFIGVLVTVLVTVFGAVGGIALANRVACAENTTRQEGMAKQLDRMENKLDKLIMK